MKTRVLLFLAVITLATTPIMAQTFDDYLEVAREVLNADKKAIVAEAMELSDAESVPFWALYNTYNAELYKVHTKRVNLIKDYAANYESMTNEKADELWKGTMSYKKELLSLNQSYYKKFKKIIPVNKTVLYFQVENKIEALINAELAEGIPLVTAD
jgi:hypothetical protein